MSEYIKLSKELQVPISFSILTCDRKIKPFDEYVLDEADVVDLILRLESSSELDIADAPLNLEEISFTDGRGVGRNMISVDARCYVYPCHMLHFEEFKVGNVLQDPLNIINDVRTANQNYKSAIEEKGGYKAIAYIEHDDIMGERALLPCI